MVTSSIMIFLDWNNEFHVHLDASCKNLGLVLGQPSVEVIDHPIAFVSKKLSKAENNYTTKEREGLTMVYDLQKFIHYLFGSHFKMFTDHSALKYLVNNLILGRKICRWILLFREYDFEVVVKPGRLNVQYNHLPMLEIGEERTNIEDNVLDA